MNRVLQSWLTLAAVPRLPLTKVIQLLQHVSIEALVELDAQSLSQLGLKPQQIEAIKKPDQAIHEACARWLEAPNHFLIPFDDLQYTQ